MKQIMGIGASHVPYLTGNPSLGEPSQVEAVMKAYEETKKEVEQFQPDLVILLSFDHLNKFFLDNVPAFCVGVAPEFDGPSDAGSGLPHRVFPGHEKFAEKFITYAYDNGFDLSYTRHWSLDHGYVVPLHLLTDFKYPVVPIFINVALPPSPTSKRCLQLGKLIRSYLKEQDFVQKVLIIGAGGLSHSVGTEDMGRIDEVFDRKFLSYLEEGDEQALASLSYQEIYNAGSATPEVMTWVTAAGAFLPSKSKTRIYVPITGFATGVAITRWETEQL